MQAAIPENITTILTPMELDTIDFNTNNANENVIFIILLVKKIVKNWLML